MCVMPDDDYAWRLIYTQMISVHVNLFPGLCFMTSSETVQPLCQTVFIIIQQTELSALVWSVSPLLFEGIKPEITTQRHIKVTFNAIGSSLVLVGRSDTLFVFLGWRIRKKYFLIKNKEQPKERYLLSWVSSNTKVTHVTNRFYCRRQHSVI